MNNKQTTMTNKATARLTAAQVQKAQALRDRRAAAAERRSHREAGIETVTEQNARLYSNIGR
jgi:hypothetical protein